jgi:hypothetical protein
VTASPGEEHAFALNDGKSRLYRMLFSFLVSGELKPYIMNFGELYHRWTDAEERILISREWKNHCVRMHMP